MSHSSTPYDILGDTFKLLSILCETFTYPTNYTQGCYSCRTLYVSVCVCVCVYNNSACSFHSL